MPAKRKAQVTSPTPLKRVTRSATKALKELSPVRASTKKQSTKASFVSTQSTNSQKSKRKARTAPPKCSTSTEVAQNNTSNIFGTPMTTPTNFGASPFGAVGNLIPGTGFSFSGVLATATLPPQFGSFQTQTSTTPPPFGTFGSKPTSAASTSPFVGFGCNKAPVSTPCNTTASLATGNSICPRTVDEVYSSRHGTSSKVVGDYDVMLNQVEITSKSSKNKFYRIQLLKSSSGVYDVFTRWGRVGEAGDYKLLGCTLDFRKAEKQFMQKFKDKTKNDWADRENFKPKKNGYEIVELDQTTVTTSAGAAKAIGNDLVPSVLPPPTQKLIQMIFDKDMFKSELLRMNLDPKRMPLGTLSLTQIQKGVGVLDTLRDSIEAGRAATSHLQTLSAKFYQLIPHAYSRFTIPPVLNTQEQLEEKYEMLSTLHDIVVAQDLEKALGAADTQVEKHSLDLKYAELNSQLDLVTPKDPLHSIIQTYIANTKRESSNLELRDIWAVRRDSEDASFRAFEKTPNHRLLWHGTNVAVVAAILKSGLRIMPSSGGRVGKGIYLANMLKKSQAYVRATQFNGESIGCLFLVEAALGEMNVIDCDDSSLTKPPTGFDSVLAKGTTHPNPAEDRVIDLDGAEVRVNLGRPVEAGVTSRFRHDEYLVYQEAQQRLRYIITFKM